MAAAISTTATTAEGQLLEVANALNVLETALSDELNLGLFNIAVDLEGKTATVTATINIEATSNGDKIELQAQEYV